MYKRKQKPAPAFLSLSSKGPKKDLTSKPPVICEAVIEANNENDSGNANVSLGVDRWHLLVTV